MAFVRWDRAHVVAVGWLVLACNDGGSAPPGPPSDLLVSGGDAQSWFFNNPLPVPLSVTVVDASGRAVRGVVVTWSVTSGGGAEGAVSPLQSTTDVSGVASTTDSLGSSTRQTVNATFTGAPGPASFAEFATSAPTAVDVAVTSFAFTPQDTLVQVGGMVTWTWNSGTVLHNVTYTSGPTPLPANSPNQSGTATFSTTFTAAGTYTYHCTIHPQMTGLVRVLH
jgi:plastocyanin